MSEKDRIFGKMVGGEMESEVVHDEEESWPSRSNNGPKAEQEHEVFHLHAHGLT
jgi:hypothetical protein